jgi:hypothetical protein
MGGSHDSGSGEKLSFLSLDEGDSERPLPLSGARDSNEVTLSNNDISNIYSCTDVEEGWLQDSVIGVAVEASRWRGNLRHL